MKIAMAQISMSADMDQNVNKTFEYIQRSKGTDLLFFPEIQWTPFFPQYERKHLKEKTGLDPEAIAISIEDGRIKRMQECCAKNSVCVSPNLYLTNGGKNYDTSLMIDAAGKILGDSRMVHIYQTHQFYERDYYTPSEDGFRVYNLAQGKVGVVICFDRHLPESIRSCAAQGAELIIIPTANVKKEPLEMFEWELRVQAYQNNVFIAMCNRVGLEGDMDFAGESIIVDCEGNVIYKADDAEQLIVQELALGRVRESRKSRPYILLRRPEQYQ